ncbi:MAG: GFA family protein [Pseudomonadota bacterium]
MPKLYPNPPYKGACLCGAVRLSITAPPFLTAACHCLDCQKLTASAFSMTTMFPAEGVEITGPLTLGALKTPGRAHYYCASCLGFVYSQLDAAAWRVNVRTMALDQAERFPPFLEVMTVDSLAWVKLPVRHSFETVPGSAEELRGIMQEFAAG